MKADKTQKIERFDRAATSEQSDDELTEWSTITMDIPIEAEVDCSDGHCGRSTSVVVNPVTAQITHLAVKDKQDPFAEHLVPIDQVVKATPDHIYLRCTTPDLAGMSDFIQIDYSAASGPYYMYGAEEYMMWPYATPLVPRPVVHLLIPSGELAVRQGAIVRAKDGIAGEVDEFLIDPMSNRIIHLVLREGHVWSRKDVVISVQQIIDIEQDGTVLLRLTRREVEALPAVPARRWHHQN
jgi:hypothetical protein